MPITPKPLEIEVACRDCGTYLQAEWDDENDVGEIVMEACQCPLNEIRKVYEKYKVDPHNATRYELWQAIKASVEPPESEPTEASTDKGYYAP